MLEVDEALDQVAQSRWRHLGPVSLVDIDDIVGAGAPGGSTHIVRGLARRPELLTALVPVHDPALIDDVWSLAVGSDRRVTLRGTPGYHQPEVELDARIAKKCTTDFGRTVRLDVGRFHVAVTERPPLPIHPSFWRDLGLRPRDADAIVQKNFFHYRMFYLTTSFRHLPVVSDGATSLERVKSRDYRVPTHPRFPLDDWRGGDRDLRA
jgi:microcystin degradation protein MlrC